MFSRTAFCFFLVLASLKVAAQVDSLISLQEKLVNATGETRIDLLNGLSHFYTQFSLDNAEEFAWQAFDAATEMNYQKGIAASYNNLGISHSIRGDYTSGLDYFIKALRIRESQNDLMGVSNTSNNIARVFIYQRDFDKALEYSNRSIEILRRIDNPTALGKACVALGMIYQNKKDNDKAYKMFTEARDIFSTHKLRTQQGWALLKMANAQEADGRYPAALQLGFAAMDYLNPNTDLFTTIELYQAIGGIYAKMNDKKKAYQYLHRARLLADRGNDSNGKLSSLLKLSELFKQFRQYDSALYYHEAYLTLHGDIFNAEKSRQLATLEKIYQTEKKDQLLKLKNEVIRSQSVTITIASVLLVALAIFGIVLYRYYRDKKRSNLSLGKLNREIQEKHEEILTQAEELTQANQEISRMNESLEREVRLRTQRIEKQNEMLIDHAFTLAHKIRGPLARILGLAGLMKKETSEPDLRGYNILLLQSAEELDAIIKDAIVNLHQGSG